MSLTISAPSINPLNTELNPICHLLALLEAHHILHVSRIRVKTVGSTPWCHKVARSSYSPCFLCSRQLLMQVQHSALTISLRIFLLLSS